MASWYSNLVTKTSSQISNLRSNLLSSEADGDTEDDTHVCRVLRNYYTDKGRPFPSWLPPDPKAPQPAPVQPLYAQSQTGSRYGGLGQGTQPGAGGGLSSLWDSNPAQNQAPAPQSLRHGRGAGSAPPAMAQMGNRPGDASQTRQLPSQQRPLAQQSTGGSGGGSSAQDRLRQRLWGGARTTSPSQSNQGQGPFQPPPPSSSSSGGGGGGPSYEDRFAPGGSYDTGRGANSSWSGGGGSDAGGGGYGGASDGRPAPPGGSSGRRMGLPSGPRGYR